MATIVTRESKGGPLTFGELDSNFTNINTQLVAIPTTYTATGSGAVSRTFASKFGEIVSVKDFGAVGDGVADDTTEVQAALNCGAKTIFFPAGTYLLTASLIVPANISIVGEGSNVTILDFSTATYASLTNARCLQVAAATMTALPSVSGAITKGTRVINFASAPTLAQNDIITIYNSTNGSWNAARTYYTAGEFAKVISVSGSAVTVQSEFCDTYSAGTASCYKWTGASSNRFKGFAVKGLDSASQVIGIGLDNIYDSDLEDVKTWNASYAGIELNQCFNVQLRNCQASDDFSSDFGADYGLSISNSMRINVVGGYYVSGRHGIVLTGRSGTGSVPCRYSLVQNAYIGTVTATVPAANHHGNVEFCGFQNCVIDGGVSFGGNNNRYSNNTVRAYNMWAFYGDELRGLQHEITDNLIVVKGETTNVRGIILDLGGDGGGILSTMVEGGTFVFSRNKCTIQSTDATAMASARPIKIGNYGYAGTYPINIVVEDNVFDTQNPDISTTTSSIINNGSTYRPFDLVKWNRNTSIGGGGLFVYTGNTAASALRVEICDNTVERCASYGFQVTGARDLITFKNNKVRRCFRAGARLGGLAATKCKIVEAYGNELVNNNIMRTWDNNDDSAMTFEYITKLINRGNTSDSVNEYILVASNAGFVIGETITGANGMTAVVKAKVTTTGLLIEDTRTGTYANQNFTGGTSATVSASSESGYTNQVHFTYTSVDTSWTGQNVHLRALANSGAATTANTIT